MKQLRLFFVWLMVGMVSVAWADLQSPEVFLRTISNQVLAGLEARQGRLTDSYIHGLVEKTVVPNVDMPRMGGSVLGRTYWNQATASQKQEFIEQFKQLVIGTYSDAMASYDDDRIEFYPIRGGYTGKSVVQVQSVLIRKNGQRVSINYDVERSGDGWKIYDFTIENISMIQSYRSQFAGTLSQGGLPALLNRLKTHNSQ